MIKLKIRRAFPDDLGEMQKLFSATITSVCVKDYSPEQIQVWVSSIENKDRWLDKIASQFCLIAECDQKMVGFGSLNKGSYVDLMYVHKDYQGQGVARLILGELEREAARCNVREITSDVSITARPFFEKNGFAVVKENINMLRGVAINNFQMMKIIDV